MYKIKSGVRQDTVLQYGESTQDFLHVLSAGYIYNAQWHRQLWEGFRLKYRNVSNGTT